MSLILMFAALLPQVSPPPIITVPPVVSTPRSPTAVLIDLQPGKVTCDGEAVGGTLARPIPVAAAVAVGQVVAPFTFTFRIGEDGRSLGIAPAPRSYAGLYLSADDLQPALAASRFPAGQPRRSCTISYVAVTTPIATAPIELVFRAIALPHARSYLEPQLQKRARDESPGCFTDKRLVVRNQAFPDYDAIPQPPGALSMTVVSYDIDASGKPVKLHTLVSDGNVALDAAGRDAIARSRYGRTARTGCSYPFYRRQATPLAPPPVPSVAEFRTNPACKEDGGRWELPPRLTFPEPFRRRAIEGWAVIRYDVAPWGQTGNVTVLASEPAAMFGDQAKQIIQSAKRPASASGATGCVDRVRFRLPDATTGVSTMIED